MPDIYRKFVLFAIAMAIAACAAPVTQEPTSLPLPTVQIDRHPEPAIFSRFNVFTQPPVYDPKSSDTWQVDLRSANLTKLDLSKSKSDLLFADFDSKTQWPSSDKMPANFD